MKLLCKIVCNKNYKINDLLMRFFLYKMSSLMSLEYVFKKLTIL